MQETSIEAWKDFKDSPSKTSCQRLVVYTLKQNGPLTGREVCDRAGQEGLWKRLSEMEKAGMVKPIGKRICSITGKKALVWSLIEDSDDRPVEKIETSTATYELFESPKIAEEMDALRLNLERVNQHL